MKYAGLEQAATRPAPRPSPTLQRRTSCTSASSTRQTASRSHGAEVQTMWCEGQKSVERYCCDGAENRKVQTQAALVIGRRPRVRPSAHIPATPNAVCTNNSRRTHVTGDITASIGTSGCSRKFGTSGCGEPSPSENVQNE